MNLDRNRSLFRDDEIKSFLILKHHINEKSGKNNKERSTELVTDITATGSTKSVDLNKTMVDISLFRDKTSQTQSTPLAL